MFVYRLLTLSSHIVFKYFRKIHASVKLLIKKNWFSKPIGELNEVYIFQILYKKLILLKYNLF